MDQYQDDDNEQMEMGLSDDGSSDFEDGVSDISFPEELADFYPKDKSFVNSFIELYILVDKLIKMIQFTRDKASIRDGEQFWDDEDQAITNFRAAKIIIDLKVIKIKCNSEMRSSLGKLLPLPDTVLDMVLRSILCGDSLEEYKFEEVPVEDIGKINMMYGRLTSIFILLRDDDEASLENTRIDLIDLTAGFRETACMEEEEEAHLASLPGDVEEDGADAVKVD